MFRCHVCGGAKAHTEIVSEVFQINGKHILVKNIPATVCERCGEATFSRETTEEIRKMLHGKGKATESVNIDVFEFSH